MPEDDQPTQAFGDPDATRHIGPDDQTRSLGSPGRAPQPPGGQPPAADDRTQVLGPHDDHPTSRIPAYHEGIDDPVVPESGPSPYREVQGHYYDPTYADRQQGDQHNQPPYEQSGQPPVPPPPATPQGGADGPDGSGGKKRSRGWAMLALGVVITLVEVGVASAVRNAVSEPEPIPTVTTTATATTTTTETVTQRPSREPAVPTQMPTSWPSDFPTELPTSWPSDFPTELPSDLRDFDLSDIPGLGNNG